MFTPDITIFRDMRARDKYKITELEAEIGVIEMQMEDYTDCEFGKGIRRELKRKQAQIERIKLRK